ncbi:MAG: hypothetical protein ACK4M1_02025 [Flavobacterium sp.]
MKKIFLIILCILFLQLNNSCKTQFSTVELQNHFTSDEIADLNKITAFFKNQMCIGIDSDFEKCYKKIPHDYLYAIGNGFWENINFKEQQNLYNQISKSTFDEIWTFCKSTNMKTRVDSKSLCSRYDGKYQKFLIALGQRNPVVKEYAKSIQDSGCFSSLDFHHNNILNNKKHLDLDDPNIQLILAIHFLTINDEQKRIEKWTE